MIRLHDYLSAPGDFNATNDVTLQVQQFASDWLVAQRGGRGGDADLGIGSYRISKPLTYGPTDPNDKDGCQGRVIGAGSSYTRFVTSVRGLRMMQFNDMWSGRIEGFSLVGPAKGSGSGLVLASAHRDYGTGNVKLFDVQASNLQYGIVCGDDVSPLGAAAEITFEHCAGTDCGQGFRSGQQNTLDLIYRKCAASNCNYGWSTANGAGGAAQITWIGGSSSNNVVDFGLWGYAEKIINFRAESGAQTGPRVLIGGGSVAIDMLTIATSTAVPVAIDVTGGGATVSLRLCKLNGAVRSMGQNPISSIVAEQNGIFAPTPFFTFPGTRLHTVDNWLPTAVNSGAIASWFPNVW